MKLFLCPVIQRYWRGHLSRKAYLRLQNKIHFESEEIRLSTMEVQLAQLNEDINNDNLLIELGNLEFFYKNIEKRRTSSAITIQRAWRRYKNRHKSHAKAL